MNQFKRAIYGLPYMRWYRLWRARQISKAPRRVSEGFLMASYDMTFEDGWEAQERALVARLLPECAGLVDIGANYGFYSLLSFHLGKKALAIEPDEGNLVVLRENLANTDIEIYPGALSEQNGSVVLYGDGDMASIKAEWQGVRRYFRRVVQSTTLDELIAGRWNANDRLFIKIDVEGAECSVLRGANATLSRYPRPYWLIETLPNLPTGPINESFAEVHYIMKAAGYTCSQISEGNYLFS